MISLCDGRYGIKRDQYNWTLMVYRNGKEKFHLRTYYPTLELACRALLDRECGDCESLQELLELLSSAQSVLSRVLSRQISEISAKQ